MADTGHGTTLTFATTGFTGQFLSIGGAEVSRPALDTSHLGTNTYRTFVPGDLVDGGEISGEFFYDPNTQPPITNAAETITQTYPIPSGSANGATEVFSGFLTSWGKPSNVTDELMKSTITIKVANTVVYADAS